MIRPSELPEKLSKLIAVDYVRGCWLWSGKRDQGYGQVHDGDAGSIAVHRLVYSMVVGAIPDGWHVHHVCGVKLCCAPDHLAAMPPGEHSAMHARIREPSTHCGRGHPYDEANTYVAANGSRTCRACRLERERQRNLQCARCSNGHEFTPDNTYLTPSGRRMCVACRKERERQAMERWRAAHPVLEAECLVSVLKA